MPVTRRMQFVVFRFSWFLIPLTLTDREWHLTTTFHLRCNVNAVKIWEKTPSILWQQLMTNYFIEWNRPLWSRTNVLYIRHQMMGWLYFSEIVILHRTGISSEKGKILCNYFNLVLCCSIFLCCVLWTIVLFFVPFLVSSVLYSLLFTAYPFASSNLSSIIIYRIPKGMNTC